MERTSMRKMLAVLISLAMIFCICPVSVSAADDVTETVIVEADNATVEKEVGNITVSGAAGLRVNVYNDGSAKATTGDISVTGRYRGVEIDNIYGEADVKTGNITVNGSAYGVRLYNQSSDTDLVTGNITAGHTGMILETGSLVSGKTSVEAGDISAEGDGVVIKGYGDMTVDIGDIKSTGERTEGDYGLHVKADSEDGAVGHAKATADSITASSEWGLGLFVEALGDTDVNSEATIDGDVSGGDGVKMYSEYGTGTATINGNVKTVRDGVDAVAKNGGSAVLTVNGDVTADERIGIYAYADPESSDDILVTGTVSGGNIGVLIDKDEYDSTVKNAKLTVWKIVLNNDGYAAGYDESADYSGTDIAQAKEYEAGIKYIIKSKQPSAGGSFTLCDSSGNALEKSHGYPIAYEDDVVIIKPNAASGYKVKAAYNNGKALSKNSDGYYYLKVPKGGGVYLTVEMEKEAAVTYDGVLLSKMTAKGSKSFKLTWTKVKNVDGYDVFFARCNHDEKTVKCKKVKTIKGNKTFKWTKSGLRKKTAYKAYVKAYIVKDGKKQYVKKSPMVHAFTSGASKYYTNPKSVTVKKTKVSIKTGKTCKIKASVNKLKKGKKLIPSRHAAKLRYLSSNTKIATVSKAGKITAKSKGTCKIYVYSVNGARKAVAVTVK